MTILGIDTIAIVVADRRKAIRWYRDVLGLPIAYIGPNAPDADPATQGTPDNPGHWIELGPTRPNTRVHLCEMGGQTEPGPTGITLLTDDIQAEYERLRAGGARFLGPPKQMDWGEWLCEFLDPDGNQFDLKQPLDSEIRAKGGDHPRSEPDVLIPRSRVPSSSASIRRRRRRGPRRSA